VERKGIIASKITKSIYQSHDTNFKLMVIKKTKKKSVTVPQHANCVSLTRMYSCRRKKNYYCYMDQIQPNKHFMGQNKGTSVPLMKKVRILC
jgi:hypothetical protein